MSTNSTANRKPVQSLTCGSALLGIEKSSTNEKSLPEKKKLLRELDAHTSHLSASSLGRSGHRHYSNLSKRISHLDEINQSNKIESSPFPKIESDRSPFPTPRSGSLLIHRSSTNPLQYIGRNSSENIQKIEPTFTENFTSKIFASQRRYWTEDGATVMGIPKRVSLMNTNRLSIPETNRLSYGVSLTPSQTPSERVAGSALPFNATQVNTQSETSPKSESKPRFSESLDSAHSSTYCNTPIATSNDALVQCLAKVAKDLGGHSFLLRGSRTEEPSNNHRDSRVVSNIAKGRHYLNTSDDKLVSNINSSIILHREKKETEEPKNNMFINKPKNKCAKLMLFFKSIFNFKDWYKSTGYFVEIPRVDDDIRFAHLEEERRLSRRKNSQLKKTHYLPFINSLNYWFDRIFIPSPNRRHCMSFCSPLGKLITMCFILCALFVLMLIPFQLAFVNDISFEKGNGGLTKTMSIYLGFEVIFLLLWASRFLTSVVLLDRGVEFYSLRSVFTYRIYSLSTWLDFIAVLVSPIVHIVVLNSSIENPPNPAYVLLVIFPLYVVRRRHDGLYHYENSISFRIWSIFFLFVIFAHFIACIYWYHAIYIESHYEYVLNLEKKEYPSSVNHYLYAIRWSVYAILSRDRVGVTDFEVFLLVVLGTVGFFFIGVILGNIISLVQEHSAQERKKRNILSNLYRTLSAMKLPTHHLRHCVEYIACQYSLEKFNNEHLTTLYKFLPPSDCCYLQYHQYESILKTAPFANVKNGGLPMEVAIELTSIMDFDIYNPLESIYEVGDIICYYYFVLRGGVTITRSCLETDRRARVVTGKHIGKSAAKMKPSNKQHHIPTPLKEPVIGGGRQSFFFSDLANMDNNLGNRSFITKFSEEEEEDDDSDSSQKSESHDLIGDQVVLTNNNDDNVDTDGYIVDLVLPGGVFGDVYQMLLSRPSPEYAVSDTFTVVARLDRDRLIEQCSTNNLLFELVRDSVCVNRVDPPVYSRSDEYLSRNLNNLRIGKSSEKSGLFGSKQRIKTPQIKKTPTFKNASLFSSTTSSLKYSTFMDPFKHRSSSSDTLPVDKSRQYDFMRINEIGEDCFYMYDQLAMNEFGAIVKAMGRRSQLVFSAVSSTGRRREVYQHDESDSNC